MNIPDHHLDWDRRFGGLARLYGVDALERFRRASICIIGIGGVGSWAAEAIARSGICRITLIDLDHIHESNMNRQIHALEAELGREKVKVMAERIAAINPLCLVNAVDDFLSLDNLANLITPDYDFIIDAIDSVKVKTALAAHCRSQRIRLICAGSAGGKSDPTRISVSDLSRTEQDPLLAKVRRKLRREYAFPKQRRHKFGIEAVTSDEPVSMPTAARACSTEPEETGMTGLNCAGLGSSITVTATFGLVAAARVLQALAKDSAAS